MTARPLPVTVIGARVPRREDAALLTGRGRFIDDIERAHQAHARIVSIDTGDAAAVPGVVAVLTHHQLQADGRVAVAPMETRGVVAEYEPGSGRYTLWTPSQGVGPLLGPLARSLGVAESRIRVITGDVGGAFGVKIPPYPEHVLVAWAARRLGRPVKWIADRSESFLSDGQGRDHVTGAELALDARGRFLAIRTRTVSNMGAYTTMAAPTIPLGRVDELSKHDPGRHDMNKRQERPTELVITSGNAAKLLELVEEPLNLLAQLVLLRIVMYRLGPVRLRRDDGLNPLHCQELTNGIAVICLVHHHRPQPRQRWHPLPHWLEPHRIITLSTGQHERHPGTLVRAGRVQLGGQSTPRATQSLGLLPTVFFDAPAAC